ncbi:uncharacterized protein LOC132307135 [Cornus florida]|uniref:uncharacterized protein LOC132307135 n=1 Tax=Cornus florida TaxID=4283 RepID=UPI00289E0052|nr:uncharacterized protein LOC132307135 [Cornus florida]
MDNNSNRESKAKAKVPRAKLSTRLQNHAPAALQLDHVGTYNGNTNPFDSYNETNFSRSAIPLLSPLIVSPPPLPEAEEKRFPENGNNQQSGNGENGAQPPTGGWQHPAMGTMTDASSLFAFFQSQCVM